MMTWFIQMYLGLLTIVLLLEKNLFIEVKYEVVLKKLFIMRYNLKPPPLYPHRTF